MLNSWIEWDDFNDLFNYSWMGDAATTSKDIKAQIKFKNNLKALKAELRNCNNKKNMIEMVRKLS